MVDQEISLSEMKKSAADFRSMGIVKSTFLRLTSTHTWAEAAEKFPLFTSTKRLSQYISLDFKHAVPEIFRTYCQAALDSTVTPSSSPSPTMNFDVNGVSVRLVEAKFSSISAQYLRERDASYCGAHLMICRIPPVSKSNILYCSIVYRQCPGDLIA